jgi:ADP-heptose:LPS heptosyltransferase
VVPAADADRQRVDEFLAAEGLASGGFAVIHAGTSAFGRYKQWPTERWAEVAGQLERELGLRAVLTRGPGQAEAAGAEAIAAAARPPALMAPLLSLRELGELFRRCRVFLSVDTGPMHLASAVGAPVVALFGPKDPRIYGPYFGRSAVVEKPLECKPCHKRSCADPRCMRSIAVDDVMAAARALIGEDSVIRNP